MGNVLSSIDSTDSERELNIDNTNVSDTSSIEEMDVVTADDLDFIAASIIFNANMKRLGENTKNGTDKSDLLVSKITKEIQPDVAISKRERIMDVTDGETQNEETAQQEVTAFYLNIARVLVAISLAIYPEGDTETVAGDTDDVLSPDFSMSRISFCGSRIQKFAKAVKFINNASDNTSEVDTNIVDVTTLGNHYGIPELYELYFDTDYDPETGAFLGMSNETKEAFHHDLKRFYTAFTGKDSVPENIKRFSDIPLHEKNNSDNEMTSSHKPLFICKFNSEDDVNCEKSFTSVDNYEDDTNNEIKDKLLSDFAEHLQKMISNVLTNQHSLIDLVNKMFVFGTRTVYGVRKRLPRVRAHLTVSDLTKITTEAHKLLANMTLQCELDNKIGDEMFVALHTIQTLESNKKQIKNLEEKLDLLLYA